MTGAPLGFVISVNDKVVSGDRAVAAVARSVDVRLAAADIQVVYDGLDVTPRLDLEVLSAPTAYRAGDSVLVQSELNYPAYVDRGELRIVDMRARGGPRLISTTAIAPNGQARIVVPEGRELVVVHRVYDANGRFNETNPVPLSRPDNRPDQNGAELGSDITAYRGIPVHGGSITVSGTSVAAGSTVTAFGETVRSDDQGRFVFQRILPAGDYDVAVGVHGPRQNPIDINRDVEIPQHDIFALGLVDLTLGWNRDSRTGRTERYTDGRAGFYVDGRTANGFKIRVSADTGAGPIEGMFGRLQDKDPRGYALRLDPKELYPTIGDSSTNVDSTPTSGRVFARVERDGSYVQWGDFRAELEGSDLVRSDRALYGFSAGYQSSRFTPQGEPRLRASLYLAQPDQLPARDVFTGTGGSVYFLSKQDIAQGTESIVVQLQDPVTGRILRSVRMRRGSDYAVNYIQGAVTLNRPLSSITGDGGVVDTGRDPKTRLIVQYEYTPTTGEADGFAGGGRLEVWATPNLRLGYTGMVEKTKLGEHNAQAVDVMWRHSADTYAKVEVARSEGVGFGYRFSADGGLTVSDETSAGGTGRALKSQIRVGLRDVGIEIDGAIGGYFEKREAGFASPDLSVSEATGDETLWGVFADLSPSERLRLSGHYDVYENTTGSHERTGGVELSYGINDQWTVDLGLEHIDRSRGTEQGRRTDVAGKLTYVVDDRLSVYGFAQGSLGVRDMKRTDRVGLGARMAYDNGWTLEGEVTAARGRWGTRLLASYENASGDTQYLGYELEPGRELPGVTLEGRDQGRLIAGARRKVNDEISIFGENSYDMFGKRRSLASAYGLTYQHSDALSGTIALEFGGVDDGSKNDFERQAASLGFQYETEDLSYSARLEYRREEGVRAGKDLQTRTLGASADLRYRITEGQRLTFTFNTAHTRSAQDSVLNGDFTEASLGYSLRPKSVADWTLFARYRYLSDMHGQQLNTVDVSRPVQRSHIFSIDTEYAVTPRWSVGGKVGARISESAPSRDVALTRNDAWLGVLSARYHFVHKWDAEAELRHFSAIQGGTSETGALVSLYRHVGRHMKIGVGYNFTSFSDDMSDLTHDNQGPFINLTAKF